MRLTSLIATMLLAVSCKHKVMPAKETRDIGELREKIALYREKINEIARQDDAGWLSQDCDALLWSSLYVVVGGQPYLEKALDDRGRWQRNTRLDCYPAHSKSSISQDMLLGLAFATWRQKAKDRAVALVAYGEAHQGPLGVWVMGDGAASRAWLRAPMQWLWREIAQRLGGADNTKPRLDSWHTVTGYEAHLQALHIWLLAEIDGGITEAGLLAMERQARRQPRNALFQAIYHRYYDGDQSAAIAILSDDTLFPGDRLPKASDRCEGYLWQRDAVKDGQANDDWLPCDSGNKHNGLDFLVAIEAMGVSKE